MSDFTSRLIDLVIGWFPILFGFGILAAFAVWFIMGISPHLRRRRDLPFGAHFSDSFVEMLKQAAAKATAECPGVLARLFLEEKRGYRPASPGEPTGKRIDFSHE